MFSNVPAVLDAGYRRLLQRLPAFTWMCGCGHAHRYEPSQADPKPTLTVICPGCHRTATLRAAGWPRASASWRRFIIGVTS